MNAVDLRIPTSKAATMGLLTLHGKREMIPLSLLVISGVQQGVPINVTPQSEESRSDTWPSNQSEEETQDLMHFIRQGHMFEKCKSVLEGLREEDNSVSKDVLSFALEVAACISGNLPVPDIYPDPDDRIEFDWELGGGTSFTLTVGPGRDIALSSDREKGGFLHGWSKNDDDDDTLPELVGFSLEWLEKNGGKMTGAPESKFVRYCYKKDEIGEKGFKQRLFHPREDELSIQQIDALSAQRIQEIGLEVGAERGDSLYGWGLLRRFDFESERLRVCVDDDPREGHTNIRNWPKAPHELLRVKKKLAKAANDAGPVYVDCCTSAVS